jgi:hypothetical protein
MVKRTLAVLAIMSLIVIAAGTSMAQMPFGMGAGCFGGDVCMARPLYVPVDCAQPIQRTIKQTWECKIEGPCPAPTPGGGACGPVRNDPGFLCNFASALGTPFDFIFGGIDGVYGCTEMVSGGGGLCGPAFGGPVPRALAALANYPTGGSFFGGLW